MIAGCNNEWPTGPIPFSYALSYDAEGNLTPEGISISLWDTYEMDFPGLRLSDLSDTTTVRIDVYDNATSELVAIGELTVYSYMGRSGGSRSRTWYKPRQE
jgi:hypothetical protein